MNDITPNTSRISHCNKSYYQITRRLVGAVFWVGLAFSPTAVLAADIVGTSGTALIINTDQSGNNAYGVKENVNDAEGGIVDIRPGGIIDNAWGGWSNVGAKGNRVNVSGGTVNEDIIGGSSDSSTHIAEDNYVSISGGKVIGDVSGGASGHITRNNHVSIIGGTITGSVGGGYSEGGNADNNSISISGGTVMKSVGGGFAAVKSRNNHVNISGGTFQALIIGGWADDVAINNTLTITGGTFANSVVLGGYVDSIITASGNTINLKVSGLSIDNIGNVNNLNFYLPDSVQNGDTVMILNDQDALNLGISGTDLTNTVIGVCAAAGSALKDGDVITLINAQNLSISSNNPVNDTSNMTGCSPVYQFALEKDNNTLIARVTKATVPQQAAQPVPGLGGKLLVLLMLLLATMTAWFIHRQRIMA